MKAIFKTLIVLYSLVTIVALAAQWNYTQAVKAAFYSEGTDLAIEQAMYEYGFEIDAINPSEPTLIEKIVALTK